MYPPSKTGHILSSSFCLLSCWICRENKHFKMICTGKTAHLNFLHSFCWEQGLLVHVLVFFIGVMLFADGLINVEMNKNTEEKFSVKSAHSAQSLRRGWREETQKCGKSCYWKWQRTGGGNKKRRVSAGSWLAQRLERDGEREADKSSVSSHIVVGTSCGERHWQYEVMHIGDRKEEAAFSCISYSHTASLRGVVINYDTLAVCDFLLWWPWFKP